MSIKKLYEMSFAEFAETIRPSWLIYVTPPLKWPSVYSEWLVTVWDSSEIHLTYMVFWRNDALKSELPPESKEYRFDDVSICPITERLGLDSDSQDDNCLAAQIMAMRNAWISAIQKHYGQTEQDSASLLNDIAVEFVQLSSGFKHPWIQNEIEGYLAEKKELELEKSSDDSTKNEISTDSNWSNVRVINARGTCPHELAMYEEHQRETEKDIRHWIDLFKSKDRGWSSEFEMHADEAQGDIDVANRKISELHEIIEKHKASILSAERIIRRNKRHEAEMRASKKIGRPEKSLERQNVAIRFTSQWVQSMMDALDVISCSGLEYAIIGSSQRNWRRWLNGDAVPTGKTLVELAKTKIKSENFKSSKLEDLPTSPRLADLLALVRLT